jgi:hypothetical protein
VTGSFAANAGFGDKQDDNLSRLLNSTAVLYPSTAVTVTFNAGVRDRRFDSESFRIPRDRRYGSHFQRSTTHCSSARSRTVTMSARPSAVSCGARMPW